MTDHWFPRRRNKLYDSEKITVAEFLQSFNSLKPKKIRIKKKEFLAEFKVEMSQVRIVPSSNRFFIDLVKATHKWT